MIFSFNKIKKALKYRTFSKMILSKRKLGVYRFCLNLDITNLVKIKMIKNIKLEVALLSDINGIVALQELYLVSNLSDKEKSGFVTTRYLS
jgi:hypothetical protein